MFFGFWLLAVGLLVGCKTSERVTEERHVEAANRMDSLLWRLTTVDVEELLRRRDSTWSSKVVIIRKYDVEKWDTLTDGTVVHPVLEEVTIDEAAGSVSVSTETVSTETVRVDSVAVKTETELQVDEKVKTERKWGRAAWILRLKWIAIAVAVAFVGIRYRRFFGRLLRFLFRIIRDLVTKCE